MPLRPARPGPSVQTCPSGHPVRGHPSRQGLPQRPARPGPSVQTRVTPPASPTGAASRGALARLPGRSPDCPFPAPAYRLRTALFPDTQPPPGAGPGPDELRSALAAAELDGAGSREALAIRSRLGEAVEDAEAWATASVTTLVYDPPGTVRDSRHPEDSGDAGDSGDAAAAPEASAAGARGEESAEELPRSASEGREALLGLTHTESPDALERLARPLAGGSGPGMPPLSFQGEFPLPARWYEAGQMFMAAVARAEAGAGAGEGAAAARPQGGAPSGLPPELRQDPGTPPRLGGREGPRGRGRRHRVRRLPARHPVRGDLLHGGGEEGR
ncbi:MAG: hypothetical protein LBT40_01530 [Deltaproteobacteria bacterium]|nr:hypothetical protein [Deltaproteobacteria bacterium]